MTENNTERRALTYSDTTEVFDKLESYAYGTRRPIVAIIREAVAEYLVNNADDIEQKGV